MREVKIPEGREGVQDLIDCGIFLRAPGGGLTISQSFMDTLRAVFELPNFMDGISSLNDGISKATTMAFLIHQGEEYMDELYRGITAVQVCIAELIKDYRENREMLKPRLPGKNF